MIHSNWSDWFWWVFIWASSWGMLMVSLWGVEIGSKEKLYAAWASPKSPMLCGVSLKVLIQTTKNNRENMNDNVCVNSLCTENSWEQSGWASEPVRLLYGLRTDSEEQLLLTYWCLSKPYSSKNTVLLNKCPGILYENILLCHKQKPTSVINTSL